MTASAIALRANTGEHPAETAADNRVVRFWLRGEGLAAFAGGTILYLASGGNALGFLPLLLLPDVAIAGYVLGPRIGAFTYNLVHNWAIGIVILGLGFGLSSTALVLAGAMLIAHVGMDRSAGYGLKYPGAFKPTHLQRI